MGFAPWLAGNLFFMALVPIKVGCPSCHHYWPCLGLKSLFTSHRSHISSKPSACSIYCGHWIWVTRPFSPMEHLTWKCGGTIITITATHNWIILTSISIPFTDSFHSFLPLINKSLLRPGFEPVFMRLRAQGSTSKQSLSPLCNY